MVIVSAEGNAADISAHLAQGLLWRSEGFYVGAPCVQPDQWRRIVVALPLHGKCNFTRCRHRKMAYGVFVELGGQGGHLNNMPLFNIGKIRRHCRYVEFGAPCVGMGVYPTIGNHEGLCTGQSLDVVGADAAAGKFIDALIAVADIPNSHAPLARLKITLCGKQPVSVAAEGSVPTVALLRNWSRRQMCRDGGRKPRLVVFGDVLPLRDPGRVGGSGTPDQGAH